MKYTKWRHWILGIMAYMSAFYSWLVYDNMTGGSYIVRYTVLGILSIGIVVYSILLGKEE